MTSTPIPADIQPAGAVGGLRGGAGGSKTRTKKLMSGVKIKLNDDRGCQHLQGGTCLLHGPGAKLRYKITVSTSTGPDGKVVKTKERHYFYTCDVAPVVVGGVKGGKLKQTQVSQFLKTTRKSDVTVCDTTLSMGEAGAVQNNFSSTTHKVGQDQTSEEQVEITR